MDVYQPSTATFTEIVGVETWRVKPFNDGQEHERNRWLPLAGELRARILNKHQSGGSLTLSMEDVLAISCELKRAERTTA